MNHAAALTISKSAFSYRPLLSSFAFFLTRLLSLSSKLSPFVSPYLSPFISLSPYLSLSISLSPYLSLFISLSLARARFLSVCLSPPPPPLSLCFPFTLLGCIIFSCVCLITSLAFE